MSRALTAAARQSAFFACEAASAAARLLLHLLSPSAWALVPLASPDSFAALVLRSLLATCPAFSCCRCCYGCSRTPSPLLTRLHMHTHTHTHMQTHRRPCKRLSVHLLMGERGRGARKESHSQTRKFTRVSLSLTASHSFLFHLYTWSSSCLSCVT